MSGLALLSYAATIIVATLGWLLRSKAYGLFRLILLLVYTSLILPILPRSGDIGGVALALHLTVYLDSLFLIRPRLRRTSFRILVSWPSQYFVASTILALPWSLAAMLGFSLPHLWFPFALGLFGLYQSLNTRKDLVTVDLRAPQAMSALGRSRALIEQWRESFPRNWSKGAESEFVVAQISDTHLGPMMSVSRLQFICERVVDAQPDLVLLTGDYLTMESQHRFEDLRDALTPLKAMKGRVYASLGNHDHEALELVSQAFAELDIPLLREESLPLEVRGHAVDLLSFDFHFKERADALPDALKKMHLRKGAFRLALLHDPGEFRHLPRDIVDLALSGHTHGGQVGLVSFGLPWTVISLFSRLQDHGLWAHGLSRLYVHRGTGHYGFPLRLGVPAEESLLRILLPEKSDPEWEDTVSS